VRVRSQTIRFILRPWAGGSLWRMCWMRTTENTSSEQLGEMRAWVCLHSLRLHDRWVRIIVGSNLKKEVVRVDRSQQQSTDLMNSLYDKLGEAVELAEELQRVAQSKQELRQARKIAKQLTNLRGNATELLYDTENRQP
jgi:hypothetical protein